MVDRSKLNPESQFVLIKVNLEDSFGNKGIPGQMNIDINYEDNQITKSQEANNDDDDDGKEDDQQENGT